MGANWLVKMAERQPTDQIRLQRAVEELPAEDLLELAREAHVSDEAAQYHDFLEKAAMADQMGRELARKYGGTALTKEAYLGPDQLIGGAIGYGAGKQQKEQGEQHVFGPQQFLSMLIPGGVGYQVGRYFGHQAEVPKKPEIKKPEHKEKKAMIPGLASIVSGTGAALGKKALGWAAQNPTKALAAGGAALGAASGAAGAQPGSRISGALKGGVVGGAAGAGLGALGGKGVLQKGLGGGGAAPMSGLGADPGKRGQFPGMG